jgi:Domain of unknown function (DUF4939)
LLLSVFTEAFEIQEELKSGENPKTSLTTQTETEEGYSYQIPIKEEGITEMSTAETVPIPETGFKLTPKEFSINKPKDFDGNRKDIQSFILDCKVYLQVNQHIFTTDASKVAFILSFMNEKEAKRWKENYLISLTDAAGDIIFPAIKEFMDKISKDFKAANKERDAAHQIAMLCQGKKTAEETITEFRLLTNQAGYANTTESDHLHLIDKLQTVLNTNLVKRILLLDEVPTTIDKWAEKAIQIDSNYRQTMEIIERLSREKKNTKPSTSKTSTSISNSNNAYTWRKKEKDPNAMDVDTLSMQKQDYLMNKGACFKCEMVGHRASEHDEYEKEQEKKKGKLKALPKKDLRSLHTLIQSLSKEEKEELLAMTNTKKEEEEKIDAEDF